jgi:nicotinate phosphoribosyltransferase
LHKVTHMRKPTTMAATDQLAIAIADYYEFSMAQANLIEGIRGIQAVFDLVNRRMPTNKVIGTFEHDGNKYEKLAKRDYLINAGLEQAAAYLLQAKGSKQLSDFLENVQSVTDEKYLAWAETLQFEGDLYAMKEGTVFFAHEPQLRVHERFEEAQVFESILLATINPQTNVATTANDIATVANKILLEGGSRRAASPQSAIYNSRAARIGGFTASSNVAFGILSDERVGGTHGHSYVMLHPSEYSAFKAQARAFPKNVCFLLDTYNMKEAFEIALNIVSEEKLAQFAFRIDSGDLLSQAKYIHQEMKQRGYERSSYKIVASDDLTAAKIAKLEVEGADIDKYLVGTYVVNPPKPVTAVYKLAAFLDDGTLVNRGKLSEEPSKATLPGIKQVYRIMGSDGFYKRDVIAFDGEDISSYVEKGDTIEELLVPVIEQGVQVYDFPTIDDISQRRKEQLARFKDITHYEVIVSNSIRQEQLRIMEEHGMRKAA